MIARAWHGMTEASKADGYLEFLHRTGIRDYKVTRGNRGVYVLRRIEKDNAHFLLISLWDSMESIKAFAGDDIEKARYYADDKRWLLEFEPNVTHYEVLVHP